MKNGEGINKIVRRKIAGGEAVRKRQQRHFAWISAEVKMMFNDDTSKIAENDD